MSCLDLYQAEPQLPIPLHKAVDDNHEKFLCICDVANILLLPVNRYEIISLLASR